MPQHVLLCDEEWRRVLPPRLRVHAEELSFPNTSCSDNQTINDLPEVIRVDLEIPLHVLAAECYVKGGCGKSAYRE
ncbi:hypothetical protein O3P69_003961 [Scylla paramamosain]|uniref:Uncharacterized protein n=1 Tax=Scylla paramamosain TaxID=85552 RepID=A0AAW0UE99_SCYPA